MAAAKKEKKEKASQHGLPNRVAGVKQLHSEQEAPSPLAGARVTQSRGLWVVLRVAPTAPGDARR